MKKILLLAFASLAFGSDIYISQTGGGTGASCASPLPVTFFNSAANWGTGSGKIGPGTTVHLCGTFTAPAGASGYLTFQGSGTSGSPITLIAETGAILQAPYWGAGGAISGSGSYITINGNNAGTIQATANGTKLANQAPAGCNAASCTVAINIANCSNCIVSGWTIANIYVNVPPNDESAIAGGSAGIFWNGGSSVTISGNTVHDAKWCILYGYPPGTTAQNINISGNTEYDCDHGVAVYSDDPGAALTGLTVSNNTIHDGANWDDTPPGGGSPSNHHDGIHISPVQSGATLANAQVFNNYIYGNWGTNCNSFIYSEADPGSGTITGMVIFNNLLVNGSAANTCANGLIQDYGNQNTVIANNTLVGSGNGTGTGSATGIILEESAPYQTKVVNNIITNFLNAYYVAQGNSLPASDYNDLSSNANIADVWGTSCCATLASWQTQTGSPDPHSVTTNPALSSAYIPATGLTGSNLSNLGFSALDKDKAGNPRPASGAWNIGAYQSGGTPPPAVPVITSFTASPASITAGQSSTLSWSVTGATALTVNGTAGALAVGSLAVSPGSTTSYTLTATNSTGSVSASATVTVTSAPVISVTVAPTAASLSANGTQQFTATVTNSTAGVRWSMSPSVGTLSAAGLYSAPASVTTQQVISVVATSVGDSTKSAAAAVTLIPGVTPPPNITTNCSGTLVNGAGTITCK
jgi:hypothetical protein